jgi:hypothetical protein
MANVKAFILTNVANGEDLIPRSCLGNDVMQNFTLILCASKHSSI